MQAQTNFPQPGSLQTFTVYGGLLGPQYTAPFGTLQAAGSFVYSQAYEILGFTAYAIGGYQYVNPPAVPPVPFLPPLGAVIIGTAAGRYALPPAFQNGPAFQGVLVALQAETEAQPNTVFTGATTRNLGTANTSHTFMPGFSIKVPQGTPVTTYIRLANTTTGDDWTMVTTLYVNILPNGI